MEDSIKWFVNSFGFVVEEQWAATRYLSLSGFSWLLLKRNFP